MLQDTATAQENHDRFVRRVIASESVWGLQNEFGFQSCESHEDAQRRVLLFWSDAAYARRAMSKDYQDCEPATIDLFSFLFRWLPGMMADSVVVGTNYTADLCGLEIEPMGLQDQLLDAMPREMHQQYQARLARELEEQRLQKESD